MQLAVGRSWCPAPADISLTEALTTALSWCAADAVRFGRHILSLRVFLRMDEAQPGVLCNGHAVRFLYRIRI
jgi:hypothetical protein